MQSESGANGRRKSRTDSDYEIDAVSKALAVIEALEGTSFEPVSIDRIVQRAELPKNLVFRTLRTLRLRGWAIQNRQGKWTAGCRLLRFAKTATEKAER